MTRRQEWLKWLDSHAELRFEGNNGGDYLTIKLDREHPDMVELEVGHGCIHTVHQVIPVELLTAMFSAVLNYHEPPIDELVQWGFQWDEAMRARLMGRIVNKFESSGTVETKERDDYASFYQRGLVGY